MKTKTVFLLLLAFITLSFWACHKVDQKEVTNDQTKTLKECKVDAAFSWETAKTLDVSLSSSQSGVIYIRPLDADYYYHKGFISKGSGYSTKITIPAYVNKLKLSFKGNVYEVAVTGNKLTFNLQ